MKTLLVAWEGCQPSQVLKAMYAKGSWRWIYAGQDVERLVEWERFLEKHAQRYPVGLRLQEVATELSPKFNASIDLLGRRHDSLGWWIGQISEKNPFVSRLFLHVCQLKLIIELIEQSDDTNWLVMVNSHGLGRTLVSTARSRGYDARVVRGWQMRLRAARQVLPSIARAMWSKLYIVFVWFYIRRWSSRLTDANSHFGHERTILIHSWLRDSVSESGQFYDQFFGRLTEMLQDLGYTVKYLVLPMTFIGRGSSLDGILRALVEQRLMFPIHRYIKWIDLVISIVVPALVCNVPRGKVWIDRWNVTALIAEERWEQMWSLRSSQAYLCYAFAKRLGMSGKPLHRIVHTSENHIWEKALCLGAHQYNAADHLVGYQHSGLGWNYNCMSPGSFERTAAVLVDTVVCNGEYWANQLKNDGRESVVVGGALRLDCEPSYAVSPPANSEKPVVLAAASGYISHTQEMLRYLYFAFRDDCRQEIWIKLHPDLSRVLDGSLTMFQGELPPHFRYVNHPISQLLPLTNVLVYCSTSVCVEAIAFGVPGISVVPETSIDFDAMYWFPHLRRAATTPEELRRETEMILSMSEDERGSWLAEAQRVARGLMLPSTTDSVNAFVA